MKKALGKTVLILACLILSVGLIFSVALSCVCNQAHMKDAFVAYAEIRNHDEVGAADFEEIAGQILTYLSTGRDADIPALRGTTLFSEKENLHLKDCSALIRGMAIVRYTAVGVLVLLFVWVLIKRDEETRRARVDEAFHALGWAAGFLFLVAAGLTVWGLIDFDSLFIAFHHVCFTNKLWVLDPEKDLLIQLMPFEFFTDYAGYILRSIAPALLILFAAPVANLLMAVKKRKNTKAQKA